MRLFSGNAEGFRPPTSGTFCSQLLSSASMTPSTVGPALAWGNHHRIVRGGYVESAVSRVVPDLIASADVANHVEDGAGEGVYNDRLAAHGYEQVLERTECRTVSARTSAPRQR